MTVPSLSPMDRTQVIGLLTGGWVAAGCAAVAELAIADLLAGGPQPVSLLAERSGTLADPLYRVLRALSVVDLLVESADQVFALAPAGHALRTDVAHSLREVVRRGGGPLASPAARLVESLRTGRSAAEPVLGTNEPPPALDDDQVLRGAQRLAEISVDGGVGLVPLLGAAPAVTGTVLVEGHLAETVRRRIEEAGLGERCRVVVGDPSGELPGADLFVLSRSLRHWDDETAGRVLREVRRAVGANGRLAVFERIVPTTPALHPVKLEDLFLLLSGPGRERTEVEFRKLFDAAGFEVTGLVEPPVDPRAECRLEATAR
ncbi:methyltransferase [Amycolatopsis azurea]|uniref:O-methyltransferase n=2 Tax=Amycolatopsis azurea DSM 43854 TaxID=1238180 RepID=M2Q9L7_9PSEU|nr:methyltransferase [Amycolatopsis azurea]EMD28655.1 O-methyltransferase [Amycolatopsis azurea DSM 43854]